MTKTKMIHVRQHFVIANRKYWYCYVKWKKGRPEIQGNKDSWERNRCWHSLRCLSWRRWWRRQWNSYLWNLFSSHSSTLLRRKAYRWSAKRWLVLWQVSCTQKGTTQKALWNQLHLLLKFERSYEKDQWYIVGTCYMLRIHARNCLQWSTEGKDLR